MPIFAWLLGAALSASAHVISTRYAPCRRRSASSRTDRRRPARGFDRLDRGGRRPAPDAAARLARRDFRAGRGLCQRPFRLAANGAPLHGKLVEARYRQSPWEVNEEGAFFLRLVYPPASASSLTGAANFYRTTVRRSRESSQAVRSRSRTAIGPSWIFQAVATWPSRSRRKPLLHRLPPTRRAALHRRWPSKASRGGAGGVRLDGRLPGPARDRVVPRRGAPKPVDHRGFAGGGLRRDIAGRFVNAPPWAIWAATLGASLTVGRRTARRIPELRCGRRPRPRLVRRRPAPASPCRARVPVRPRRRVWPPARRCCPCAGSACAPSTGSSAEVCESRVDELFARRARLAATALAIVGAYGLWQSPWR